MNSLGGATGTSLFAGLPIAPYTVDFAADRAPAASIISAAVLCPGLILDCAI